MKKNEIINEYKNGGIAYSINNIYEELKNSDLAHKKLIEQYIIRIENIINNDTIQYFQIQNSLDNIFFSSSLEHRELVFLKTLIETAKKSSYFWLPASRGGSNEGYTFLKKISHKQKTVTKFADIVLADMSSASISFLCCWWTMVNPGSLIGVGIGSAMASALAAITDNVL